MRLCSTHSAVRRVWTVELRPEHGGLVLYCPQCPPGGQCERAGASQALAHLAGHARRDSLPPHLRTCQCQPQGCRWHQRHRGCSGAVVLVLSREHGGRLWRLADVCAACAAATQHAAVVPETTLTKAAPGGDQPRRRRGLRGPSKQVRTREMLSYLASALPPQTTAASRLLALQCALRSTASGCAWIPAGLVRGMRLNAGPAPFAELEDARWLHRSTRHTTAREGFSVQLLDIAMRMQAPARRDRARTADWILLTCRVKELRRLGPLPRLLALALAAHSPTGGLRAPASVEQEVLARMCGLTLQGLSHVLDVLVGTHFLHSWEYGRTAEELRWELRPPDRLVGSD